jgi:hypothetical protein
MVTLEYLENRNHFEIWIGGIDLIWCKIHNSRELAAFLAILTSGVNVNRCEMHYYGDFSCIMALLPWRDQSVGKYRIRINITRVRYYRDE